MTVLGSFSVQHVCPRSRRRTEPVVLGEPFAAAHLASNILRAAAPFDFPASSPIYILEQSAVPKWKTRTTDWGAVACDADDLSMKPALKAVGAFKGPGFAAVFRDGWITSQSSDDHQRQFQAGLGILVHEAAHWLCRPSDHMRGRQWSKSGNAATSAYWGRLPEAHTAYQHDATWVRAALHLHQRVNAAWSLELADCRIAGDYYGLSDSETYRLALADELQAQGNGPINQILTTDPPAMFAGFWSQDCHKHIEEGIFNARPDRDGPRLRNRISQKTEES